MPCFVLRVANCSRGCFVHNTEEVAVRVLEHDKVSVRWISPWIAPGAKAKKSAHFACLIARVQVEMEPIAPVPTSFALLEGQVWPSSLWILENDPSVADRTARHIVERGLPERNHPVEFVAVNNDGANPHFEFSGPADERSRVLA